MPFTMSPIRPLTPQDSTSLRSSYTGIIAGACILLLIGLFLISHSNYLLFHALAELFSIAVAWSVFLLVWNLRPYMHNDALFLLGTSYLFIGLLDLLHTLAYKGMGIFQAGDTTDLATQLWISGRGLEAAALFFFPLLLGRRLQPVVCISLLLGIFVFLLMAIFTWKIFPQSYVPGFGLTPFKINTEYAICLILGLGIILLSRQRKHLDPQVFIYMMAAMFLTIAGELFFTLYVNVYDLSNLIGHYCKIISYFFIYFSLIRSGLSNPYAVLFQDLFEEKEAVQRVKEDYRITFESIGDAIIVTNASRCITRMNPMAEQLTGWSGEEAKGRHVSQVFSIFNSQTGEKCEDPVGKVLDCGQIQGLANHTLLQARDGREFHIADSCAPILTEDKSITGVVLVFRNVTEQKHKEEELQLAKSQAEKANKAKSEFLAKMSHEIRTPMNSILGMLRLVLSSDIPIKERKRIQVAKDSAESLLWLLNDLLDLSKIEAGQFTLHEREFRLQRLLNNVLREMEVLAADKDIPVSLNIDQRLPKDFFGDSHRLKRILINLLSNAIKFTEKGWISLEAKLQDISECSTEDEP